jgi:uncharacterized protein (DUF1778 family)
MAYAIATGAKDCPSSTSILSVRVSPDERAILEAAAELDVLNRVVITIPARDWDEFESWLNRPAETIPALKELGGITPSWDR